MTVPLVPGSFLKRCAVLAPHKEHLREPHPPSQLCCTNVTQPPPFNPERLPEIIEETRKRFARVQIENLPYEEMLRRYDRPTTLAYLVRTTGATAQEQRQLAKLQEARKVLEAK